MRKILGLVLVCLYGCSPFQSHTSSPSDPAEEAVRETFFKWRENILQKKWEEAYQMTSSRVKGAYSTFEQWKQDFENSSLGQLLRETREVKKISVDETGATLQLLTSGGTTWLLGAENKNGLWKIGARVRTPQ